MTTVGRGWPWPRALRLCSQTVAALVSIDEALCHFFSGNPSDKRREVRVERRLIAVEVVARGPTAGGVTVVYRKRQAGGGHSGGTWR